MKKTIKLLDLDCAHCAAKIEDAVKKIDGVTPVSYTHLDVYKRQAWRRSPRYSPTAWRRATPVFR